MIWGYDISKLNGSDHTDIHSLSRGKLLFDSHKPAPAPSGFEMLFYDENGVHRDLYRGVFITDPVYGLNSQGVSSLEQALDLDGMVLKNYDETLDIGDDEPPKIYHHCGLCSAGTGIPFFRLAEELTYLPDELLPITVGGEEMSKAETESIFTVISHILSAFDASGMYNLIFFQYLFHIMSDKTAYDKECFENMFLLTFSEAPMTAEAVRAVIYDGCINLINRNIPITDVFEVAVFRDEAVSFLADKLSAEREEVRRMLNDSVKILRCFEK